MSDIRALTVRQPWAGAISLGVKRVENRTWRTNYRGPLLIHAGSQAEQDAEFPPGVEPASSPVLGAIIAIVDLTDCHYDAICCGVWAQCCLWHWRLDNIRPLQTPIPCRGSLGLWRPNPETLTQIGVSSDECDR